jgi:hypothetical protein
MYWLRFRREMFYEIIEMKYAIHYCTSFPTCVPQEAISTMFPHDLDIFAVRIVILQQHCYIVPTYLSSRIAGAQLVMQSYFQNRQLKRRVRQHYKPEIETGRSDASSSASSRTQTVSTEAKIATSDDGENSVPNEKIEATRDPDSSITLVEFDGDDDPSNPHNWTFMCKVRCICVVTCIGFIVSWAGSIDSSASRRAAHEFGVSDTIESLATGLFLIAFGMGSFLASPVSETFGRNPVYITSL